MDARWCHGSSTKNGRRISLIVLLQTLSWPPFARLAGLTGAVLDDSNLDIVVDVRGYHNLPSTFHDSRICLGLASNGERVLESCFEQVNADATKREEPRGAFTDFEAIRVLLRHRCSFSRGMHRVRIATSRTCALPRSRALSDHGNVAFDTINLPRKSTLVRLAPVDRLSPTCSTIQQFEQGATDLVFHASGLLAGQSYALRVVLFERSNALAVSMRSFRVGAVSISDGMTESSPVTIQVRSAWNCSLVCTPYVNSLGPHPRCFGELAPHWGNSSSHFLASENCRSNFGRT